MPLSAAIPAKSPIKRRQAEDILVLLFSVALTNSLTDKPRLKPKSPKFEFSEFIAIVHEIFCSSFKFKSIKPSIFFKSVMSIVSPSKEIVIIPVSSDLL